MGENDKRYFPAKINDEIRLNEEEIVAIQNENLLKYSSKWRENEHQNTYLAAQAQNGLSTWKNVPKEVEECKSFQTILLIPTNDGSKQLWELQHSYWNLLKT